MRFHHGQIAAVQVGQLIVNVVGYRGDIDNDAWSAYVAECDDLVDAKLALTLTPWAGPNAAQRKQLNANGRDQLLKQMTHVVLLSESTLVRGTMTALGWLVGGGAKINAFKPSKYVEALDWLTPHGKFDRALALHEMFDYAAKCGLDVNALEMKR